MVAPRGCASRRIWQLIEENPARAQRFRFTSAERLSRFVLRHDGKAIAARAAGHLKKTWPMLSAGPPRWHINIASVAIAVLLTIAAAFAAPATTALAAEVALAAIFLAWLGLRLRCVFVKRLVCDASSDLPDDALPVYTVIAALYREAASVDGLLRAIERLNYPAEKLDVIIAVEADDRETRAAIATRSARIPITVIPVPAQGPRTKPKALNVALPFAHGTFTVIYDAEDRPEPNQLRRALQAFRAGGDDLGCVQARLCIDNSADSWLARLFTAEYAGQFDVFLPGLAALRLAAPARRLIQSLSYRDIARDRRVGSLQRHGRCRSRHAAGALWLAIERDRFHDLRGSAGAYRTVASPAHALVQGLDADLAGAHASALPAVARSRSGGLLHLPTDRRRQCAGGAGASAVHGRVDLFGGERRRRYGAATARPTLFSAAVYGTTVIVGYLASAFLGWLGLLRRGLLSMAWVLLLTPLHWLLLSLAAWRALYQLVLRALSPGRRPSTAWRRIRAGPPI